MDEILQQLKEGELVIVTDDTARENEADLVMAAEFVTPEKIAFILRHTSGIICVPLTKEKAAALNLRSASDENTSKHTTPFLTAVDAKNMQDNGVSAADRATTIHAILEECTDLSRPGHVYPLLAAENGTCDRAGHTEATIDLLQLADLRPVGVLCELMNPDGTMMRDQQPTNFSREHDLPIISINHITKIRGCACPQTKNTWNEH